MKFVGLMSGTSLDGVDAALVEFSSGAAAFKLLGTHYAPFPDALRAELLSLQAASPDELHRAALASVQLAARYAESVKALLAASHVAPGEIAAIGCHGQTVRHRPELGYTLQLNNPALLAELTDISVAADFRSRDVAAGGQGAPLAPAFHAACFRSDKTDRAVLNLGGIANLTLLPRDGDAKVIGFDTGTANVLLDAWAERHLGRAPDQDGAWAAGGKVNAGLLAAWLGDAWFGVAPPKSTGRDAFHMEWAEQRARAHLPQGLASLAAQDVQATLAELSAASIADALSRWCPGVREVYACGGGVHNRDLMRRIAARLDAAGARLETTQALGLDPDWVEAVAFAWLARQAVENRPGNLASVTGARGPRVLGAIYPR